MQIKYSTERCILIRSVRINAYIHIFITLYWTVIPFYHIAEDLKEISLPFSPFNVINKNMYGTNPIEQRVNCDANTEALYCSWFPEIHVKAKQSLFLDY